jgi:hypothetical protein
VITVTSFGFWSHQQLASFISSSNSLLKRFLNRRVIIIAVWI